MIAGTFRRVGVGCTPETKGSSPDQGNLPHFE